MIFVQIRILYPKNVRKFDHVRTPNVILYEFCTYTIFVQNIYKIWTCTKSKYVQNLKNIRKSEYIQNLNMHKSEYVQSFKEEERERGEGWFLEMENTYGCMGTHESQTKMSGRWGKRHLTFPTIVVTFRFVFFQSFFCKGHCSFLAFFFFFWIEAFFILCEVAATQYESCNTRSSGGSRISPCLELNFNRLTF